MSHSPSCFGRERGLLGYPTAGLFLLHHLLHAAPWRSSLVLQAVLYGFQISANLAYDPECYTRNDDNNDYEDVTDEISQQNARRWTYNNPWKDNRWNQVSLHANPIKIVLTASICFDYLHVMSSHFSLSLSTYLHCVHMRLALDILRPSISLHVYLNKYKDIFFKNKSYTCINIKATYEIETYKEKNWQFPLQLYSTGVEHSGPPLSLILWWIL